ncbi:MAG: hypothetical protein ACRD5M_04825 [Candidatus Acidiferrales bacterium]
MTRGFELALLALQSFHVAFLFLHDWIPLGSLNNISAVRRVISGWQLMVTTLVSGVPFAIGLAFSLRYYGRAYPHWLHTWLWVSYGLLFLGELRAWWIPYLIQPEPQRATRYQSLFASTHSFLPARNGIVPNTLHVILHAATFTTVLLLSRMR